MSLGVKGEKAKRGKEKGGFYLIFAQASHLQS
jgi:hypothetical protein